MKYLFLILKKMEEINEIRNKLDKQIQLLQIYYKCIGKNGISYHLLKNIVPIMSDSINELLKMFINLKINIMLNGTDIDIIVIKNGVTWDISNCSGFEKFIISIAFRIVIQKLANISKPNFIAFDEGWGCFDKKHINNVDMLFDFMKIHYKFIILITHIETLKHRVDKYITISHNNINEGSIIMV